MKKIKYGLVLFVGLITLMSVSANNCNKYVIDGDLSDWGPDLTQDWSVNGTWLPNPGVYFVVEDNRDPRYGVPPMGVHIKGVGSYYTTYEEPKVQKRDGSWIIEPYGSDYYDIEAIYLDQDDDCIYVAVVTGEDPDATGDARPGDLALNLDGDPNTGEYGYEYGIKLGTQTGLEQFGIYSNPDWQEPYYIPMNRPGVLLSGNKVGKATGKYVDSGIYDNGYTNYIIELAIPKSAVGNPGHVSIYNLHLSEGCGNEHIPAAEFPIVLSMVLLLTSPAFAYLLYKKRH